MTGQEYTVKDLSLADQGKKNIEWAEKQMGALMNVRQRFARERPLKNVSASSIGSTTRSDSGRSATNTLRGEKRLEPLPCEKITMPTAPVGTASVP